MRFAYIDSNGNEVPIPSVDALALRIELGAIHENTELYDAQADQWGPAHTHEIYHTLVRAAEDEDFVAPPPPVRSAPASTEARAAEPKRKKPEPPSSKPKPKPKPKPQPQAEHDPVSELTLAAAQPPPPEPEGEDGDDGFDFDIEGATPVETIEKVTQEAAESLDEGPSFDFGDMSGGLEMEPALADEPAGAGPVMDFGADAQGGGGFEFDAGDTMDFGGGLEQKTEFSSAGFEDVTGAGGALDLEQPMSEFRPGDPPAWMEGDDAGSDDAMDFSGIATEDEPAEVGTDVRPKRKPKDRPSAPKFKRQRSVLGPMVGVLLLAAIGVGAYVAWPIASAWLENRGAPDQPEVVLPPIPDELMPQYRAASDAAFAAVFQEVGMRAGSTIPRPGDSWLAGVYLASASSYPEVETFWLGIGDQLASLRDIDAASFRAAFARALPNVGAPEASRALLQERADSGFVAARGERAEVFGLVDQLVDAALGLHEFLIANEASIEYTPAATGTIDPVLEASPATPELRQAMQERIGRVTEALDGLDYLDLVTANGLWAAVLARIQEDGVR